MAVWLNAVVGKSGWSIFVAYDGAEPAGAAAMYVDGEYAWLGIGAVKAEKRGRGAHSALLARRIAEAKSQGSRWVITETGVPQPSQPAPSYKNILAAAFEVAYQRPNWTPKL